MDQNFIKDVYARLDVLKTSKNLAKDICNKMNAEFHACFYESKGNVWMSFIKEDGKQDFRNFGVC
jgi:hypothetical protein